MEEGVVLEGCQSVNLLYIITALAWLKNFPFKGSRHLCDATCVVVVISNEYSSATLSSFQISYAYSCVRVLNSCCIFQLGPDECLVAGVLGVLRTVG